MNGANLDRSVAENTVITDIDRLIAEITEIDRQAFPGNPWGWDGFAESAAQDYDFLIAALSDVRCDDAVPQAGESGGVQSARISVEAADSGGIRYGNTRSSQWHSAKTDIIPVRTAQMHAASISAERKPAHAEPVQAAPVHTAPIHTAPIHTAISRLTPSDLASTRVAGYALLRCFDDAELIRIAVRPDMRQQGIGGSLLRELLAEAGRRSIPRIYLEVRSGNTAAITLYTQAGFTIEGVRRDYYSDPREDAVIMRYTC